MKMKNKDIWTPTKFVITKNGLKASRDPKEVGRGSRFIADIQAELYEKALKEHAKGLLLDLGCGKVPLYEIYKPHITDNICIDWPNTSHPSLYLDYEYDLNKVIPLKSSNFDTILASDVLEHIANPDIFWSEIARLLKPKGKLIMGIPFLYWIHEAPYDYYRYTEYKLRMFCDKEDLKIVMLETFGGFMEVIIDMLAKRFAPSRIPASLITFFGKTLMLLSSQKKSQITEIEKFPLGYCLVAEKNEA